MTKQRVETISTTIFLILFAGSLHILFHNNVFAKFPYFATIMLVATAIYVFGGCILQTFGFRKIAIGVGVGTFFALCTCLFYSTDLLDYTVFFVCMALVIRKSSKLCGCMGKCNPLT